MLNIAPIALCDTTIPTLSHSTHILPHYCTKIFYQLSCVTQIHLPHRTTILHHRYMTQIHPPCRTKILHQLLCMIQSGDDNGATDLSAKLTAAAPTGIDMYFDNVGGGTIKKINKKSLCLCYCALQARSCMYDKHCHQYSLCLSYRTSWRLGAVCTIRYSILGSNIFLSYL